jgi:hypothetical protein
MNLTSISSNHFNVNKNAWEPILDRVIFNQNKNYFGKIIL